MDAINPQSQQMMVEMYKARQDAVKALEESMQALSTSAKEANEKANIIENLVKKVLAASNDSGDCDLSGDVEGKKLIDEARAKGLPIAQKYTFTKVERDELVNTLKAHQDSVDAELERMGNEGKAEVERRQKRMQTMAEITKVFESAIKSIVEATKTAS